VWDCVKADRVIIPNWAVEQPNKYALHMFAFLGYSVK